MTYDGRSRRSTHRDDDWVPPAWNPAHQSDERPRIVDPSPDVGRDLDARSEPRPERTPRPHESGFVLGLAIAPAVVGILSTLGSFLPFLSGGGSVPRGLMMIVVLQLLVAAVLRVIDLKSLMRSWVSTVICTAVLVPLLALQVTLLREPYLSWSRGSASPALIATLIVGMVLIVGAVWAVASSWEDPDVAGLLFMPLAMVVPAMTGMRSAIMEQPALEILGRVMLLAAVVTAVAWILPPSSRILTPPIAVAIEFVILWVSGYGPWFHATSGDIVRVLYSLMLVLTVVLVVAVPFAAMWVEHGANTARHAQVSRLRRAPRKTPISRGPVIPR